MEEFDFEVKRVEEVKTEGNSQVKDKVSATPIPVLSAPSKAPGSAVRRSSRVVRKPTWTTDFVPK